ncbi:hypothetical protein EV684_1289, partial [Rubrivivax gelatinosus]
MFVSLPDHLASSRRGASDVDYETSDEA